MDQKARLYQILKTMLYDATYKNLAHERAFRKYAFRNKISAWTQSILSLVVGVTSLSTFNAMDDCGSSTNGNLIVTGVILSFLSASIGATRNTLKFAEKCQNNQITAQNFAELVSDIELFLTKDLTVELLRTKVAVFHERMQSVNGNAATISERYYQEAINVTPTPVNGIYSPLSKHRCKLNPELCDNEKSEECQGVEVEEVKVTSVGGLQVIME